jgi:hypothetical protein
VKKFSASRLTEQSTFLRSIERGANVLRVFADQHNVKPFSIGKIMLKNFRIALDAQQFVIKFFPIQG